MKKKYYTIRKMFKTKVEMNGNQMIYCTKLLDLYSVSLLVRKYTQTFKKYMP